MRHADRNKTTGSTDDQTIDEPAEDPVQSGSIVVGLDGSVASNRALAWAVAEATRRQRPLHLLCARETYIGAAHLDSSVAWTDPSLDALDSSLTVVEEAREYVKTVSPDLQVAFSRPWGRPAQHLVVASRVAEIVVVGSRGHSRLASVVLGTVSLQTAAHARCPVIVVREGQPEHPAGSLKIAVGVDGSSDAREAVRFAMRTAGPGGDVELVLAWWLEVVDGVVVTTPGTRYWEEIEARHRVTIQNALGALPQEYPQVNIEVTVSRGRTEDVLLKAVQDVDLLVVGSRGRGGFAGLLLGSVSQHMLTIAPCPVAIMVNRREDD
ncbi:MAG: universal stress protein [Micrococcales bacterium]|nr:universal stress protein [Micrococcales bacterium]